MAYSSSSILSRSNVGTGEYVNYDGVVETNSSDQVTYYMRISFNDNGVAYFRMLDVSTGGSVIGWMSSQSNVDSATGIPRRILASGSASAIGQSYLQVFQASVTAGVNYYFLFRSTTSATHLYNPQVYFEATSQTWSDDGVLEELQTFSSEIMRIIHPTEGYKLYCYKLTSSSRGYFQFIQEDMPGQTTETFMYITTSKDSGGSPLYDLKTGRIPQEHYSYYQQGPYTITFRFADTCYLWVRHREGTCVDDIKIRVVPIGDQWRTVALQNAPQTVTTQGASWGVHARDIGYMRVGYIPLQFTPNGEYEFSQVFDEFSDGKYDGYLTTSLSLDSNGYPTDIVAQQRNMYDGFSFRATVSAQMPYYFMVRRSDGEPNDYAFDLNIDYIGGGGLVGPWRSSGEDLGTQITVYENYHHYDQYYLYKRIVSFENAGQVKFYSAARQNAVYPKAWITVHTDEPIDSVNGEPPSGAQVIGRDENPDADRQFDITANVSAYTRYDFWFRLPVGTATGYGYIYIVPPGTTIWQLDDRTSDRTFLNISGDVMDQQISIQAGYVAEYLVSFTSAGTARFFSSGNIALSAYLNRLGATIDRYTGVPGSYQASGIGNNNFIFSFQVDASRQYHLWIKGNDGLVSGNFDLSIQGPGWKVTPVDAETVMQQYTSGSISIDNQIIYRVKFVPSSSGEYTLKTYGSTNTYGYLGTDPTFDKPNGKPLSYSESDEPLTGNCQITATLTAGTTYYFWVRNSLADASGNTEIRIESTVSPGANIGFWVGDNSAWVKAIVVWLFDNNSWDLVEHPSICIDDQQNTWIIGT